MVIRAVYSVEVLLWNSDVTQRRLSIRDADMTKRPQHRLRASHYKSALYRWPPTILFFSLALQGTT